MLNEMSVAALCDLAESDYLRNDSSQPQSLEVSSN